MILDLENRIISSQAITATGAGDDYINLRTIRHLGIGHAIGCLITVEVAPGGTTPSFVFKLQVDSTSGFASPTDLPYQVTVPQTATTKSRYWIPIPPDATMEQFLRAHCTASGTTPTVTVSAYLMRQGELQGEVYYAKAYEAE